MLRISFLFCYNDSKPCKYLKDELMESTDVIIIYTSSQQSLLNTIRMYKTIIHDFNYQVKEFSNSMRFLRSEYQICQRHNMLIAFCPCDTILFQVADSQPLLLSTMTGAVRM